MTKSFKTTSGNSTCARRGSRAKALSLAAGAALSVMAMATSAQAQYQWSNNTSTSPQNWGTATNWVGPVPVAGGSINDTMLFTYNFGSGAFASNNNLAGAYLLNSLTMDAQASAGFTLSATAGSTLTFSTNGSAVAPSLVNSSSSAGTISSLVTLANNTTISGAGVGALTMSGVISGPGGLVLGTTGPGVVSLNAANTFLGGTTMNSGEISTSVATGMGPAGSTVTVNGGRLRLSAAATLSQNYNITPGSTFNITGAFAPTFSGSITGSGGISYRPTASATITFTGSNSFSGNYYGQAFGNAVPSITLSGNGAWTGVSGITMEANQTLLLDNAATNVANRINDTAPISLMRAGIQLNGNAAATSESLGAITFSGSNSFATTPNAASNTTLTVASMTRANRGSAIFTGTNMGTAGGANTSNFIVTAPSITGDMVGGGGLPGSTNVSILPYAYAAHTVGGVSGGQLVTYDPVTGIRPLAAAEYVPSAIVARGSSTNNNFKSSGTARMIGVTGVNAMVIDSASAAAIGSGVYGAGILKPASGVTMFSVSGGGTASTLPSILAMNVLEFGSNEGIIHTQNLGAITSIISGSNGLTKSGFAPLILAGNNKYTGTTSITGSILHVASDSALGDPSNGISLSGGNVSGLNFAPSNLFGSSTAQSLTINRPVSLDGAGGGLSASLVNTTLTVNGVISGSGRLLTGTASLGTTTGVLKLTNTNTYSGATIIFGNVAVTSDGALGTNSEVVGTGGFLRADGQVTSARNFTLSGSLPLLTNGFNMTLNGTISNQAATPGSILKGGAGNTLTLTGNSQFNGTVQVGLAAPLGDMDHLDTGGTMVLSGNGALTAATGVSILSGSTFRLDNTGTNNGNRINANVSLGGGTFEFLGNGSAASTETIGTLAATSFSPAVGNGVGLVNLVPGAGQSAVVTASNFTRTGVGSMLVRGNNLGGAIGANTANLVFNTAPTLTNGVIPGVVVDNSLVGSGTDLATYTAGTGVRALNGAEYTVNPGAFAAATNADLTVNTATPTATVNAVRMGGGAGGISIAAANTLTVGSGMILATGGGNSGITGGTLAFGAVPATIWANDNTLISSVITGTGGMNKAGPGTLTIGTASTLATGGVTVSNGRLVYGVANAFPTTVAMTLGTTGTSIGTWDLNGTTSTVASFGGFGNIDLNGGNLISAGGATAFAGGIVGTGTVTIGGSMTINGVSSFTGDTTVRNAGTLTVGANQPTVGNGPLGSGGNLVLGDATTAGNLSFGTNVSTMNKNIVVPASTALSQVNLNTSANVIMGGNMTLNRQFRFSSASFSSAAPFTSSVTIAGTIQDGTTAGSIDIFGGNWNLWGNNTYTGGTNLNPGLSGVQTMFIGLGTDSAFGTGLVTIGAAPGVLRADQGARTIANNVSFASATPTLGVCGINDLNLSGQVDIGGGTIAGSVAGAKTLQITNAGITRMLGIVSGAATSTITKVGGGTLLMSANNTFAGNVNVNAGALIVNGNNSGAGVYAVANGALLGGSGTIAGAVSFAAGAALEPGNSAGTISTGAMTLAANSIMMWELGDSTIPSANDLAAVTGNLSIAGGVGTVVLHLETLPGFALLNGKTTWTIMTYTGTLTGAPANFLLANVPAGVTGAVIDTTTVPGSVILSMVPAPGTGGLLAMAGILASRRRRRN